MNDDNIIKLQNNAVIPHIVAREGTIVLHYAEECKTYQDSIELTGTITVSEVCFLHKLLGKWIDQKIDEMALD